MGHRAGLFGFAAGGCFLVAPGEHLNFGVHGLMASTILNPQPTAGPLGKLNMINSTRYELLDMGMCHFLNLRMVE